MIVCGELASKLPMDLS